MNSGKPVGCPANAGLWRQRVWSLAWPIMLSNLSVPLVGAVDTAVVGRLPDPIYIGAVAVGAIIFSFLYWGFSFLRMGTTGFVAQCLGAGDRDELRAVIGRALLLALILGTAIVVAQRPLGRFALWAMEASDRVEDLAWVYFSVRIWSAPAALANYAVLGFLIGIQNTRAALLLQLVLNLSNVLLDLLFVSGFGWGVDGVALATLISEYAAAGVGIWIVVAYLHRSGGHWRRDTLLSVPRIKALLQVNANIMVRTLCLTSAFFYFTSIGARFGDTILAANAVLMLFQNFLAFGLDGFAHATEALVGSAIGRRNRADLRNVVTAASLWAIGFALLYSLIFVLAGTFLISLITAIPAVQTAAADYLYWLILSPLVSVWSFQLDGIFIGATRTAAMRNAMLASLAIFLACVWILIPIWGNHGLWLALIVFMLARAMTLAVGYRGLERALTEA